MDDYNREVLFIETDYSLKSNRILWVLLHLAGRYGKPQKIRMDNGPKFVANEIAFKYTEPGKPMQNAYIERFNKTYREGIFDAYLFDDLEEVREITAAWLQDHNMIRPHDALGDRLPYNYRQQNDSAGASCCAAATPAHYQNSQSNESVYL